MNTIILSSTTREQHVEDETPPPKKNKQHTGDKWVIPFWLAVQGLCFRFFTAMLRAPDISVEVCLLSGRSCLVAISPSDNVMLLLQRSREKLDVDISTFAPWNLGDEITTFVSSRKSWSKMESVWFIYYEEWIRRWIDEEIIENKPVYITTSMHLVCFRSAKRGVGEIDHAASSTMDSLTKNGASSIRFTPPETSSRFLAQPRLSLPGRLYAGAKALPLGHRLVDLGIKNGAVLTGAVVNVQVISSLEASWIIISGIFGWIRDFFLVDFQLFKLDTFFWQNKT